MAKIVSNSIAINLSFLQMKENKNPQKQKAGTGMIFEKTKYIKSKFTNGDDLPILKEDQPAV